MLGSRSIFVTRLDPLQSLRGAAASVRFARRPARSWVSAFRSLATLVSAGVSLARALSLCGDSATDSRLREALRSVLHDIRNGSSLSDAMGKRPRDFSSTFVAAVRAGETGGALDDVLGRLAHGLERELSARKKVIAALAYPAVVAVTACGLVVFLMTSVVPAFAGMYAQLRVPLPAFTALLVGCSAEIRQPLFWGAFAAASVAICSAAVTYCATERGRRAIDAIRFGVPVGGSIARKAALAHIARTLATLLQAGVSLPRSLELAAAGCGPTFGNSLRALSDALATGSTIARPLAALRVFDPVFVQMVQVGEETGSLDAMLARVADYYDLDVETALATLGSTLEPLMIVFLGGIVGSIVASVLIPLYTLIGSVK